MSLALAIIALCLLSTGVVWLFFAVLHDVMRGDDEC